MVVEGGLLRIGLGRAWRSSVVAWWSWALTTLVCAAALAAAAWSIREAPVSVGDHSEGTIEASALQPQDFAHQLSPRISVVELIQDLQRTCAEAGVTLVTLQAHERPASPDQLGRIDLVTSLRGAYVGSHRVLKHMLERYPTLTIGKLRLRRATGSNDVEAAVTLSLWAAPLPAPDTLRSQ